MRIIGLAVLLLLSTATAQAGNDLLGIYQGYESDTQKDLVKPHRSLSELEVWISDNVADALNFAPGKSIAKINTLRANFTQEGYRQYVAFLTKQGLLDGLKTQTLSVATIVNNAPLLMGQGASAGRYAWAFELPVVMSLGADNRNITLRVQIGRNTGAKNTADVLIESWQEFVEKPADPS